MWIGQRAIAIEDSSMLIYAIPDGSIHSVMEYHVFEIGPISDPYPESIEST
jgi:hypothetical protein